MQFEDVNENLQPGFPNKKELKVTNSTEITEQRLQVNNITVSKKRNWLQQSSLKFYSGEENSNGSFPITGDAINHLPNPANHFHVVRRQVQAQFQSATHQGSSPTEPQTRNSDFAKPSPINGGSTKNASPTNSSGTVDTSEENDADDEGEIWYNPIPEDDEVDMPRGMRSCRTTPSKLDYLNKNRHRDLSAGELIKLVEQTGDSAISLECVEDLQAIPVSDAFHANSSHSTEPHQLHRQVFACKAQNGGAVEENPANKSTVAAPGTYLSNGTDSAAAFPPPSSPNPSKKVGSINWSLPEKIKSPRTVRKLSMKMKKLPELSRKLSVKGTASHNGTDNHSVLSKSKSHNGQESSHGSLSPAGNTGAASRNVISRYHLDSSVVSQHSCYKKKHTGGSKSASKGGYLSDWDSPELVAKSGKHSCEGKFVRGKEEPVSNSHKPQGTEIDIDAFRHYSFIDQPKCSHYISGLMSVHFYGAEDLKPPRMDSRDVFCAIQVDSINKARTALLTCRTTFLDMDHTFNIELENAQHLKLVVFSWEPTPRKNRVCCHGTVVLPTLFRVIKMHQLAVKLEPRGLIYVKLTLMEQWENSLDSPGTDREPVVFGVEACKVVEKENAGLMVPLLIEKCIREIEKRGCQVVGLYRLCGSAAVKKELREVFERDSKAVELRESLYPDINVITGVLKDYLRELPSPIITKQLYEAVLDAMKKRPLKMTLNGCENDPSDSDYATHLLDCLPEVERATLRMLLDHLKLVASFHEVNKMTCQNLAVCFGPVLLSQRQEASNHSNRVFIDSEELASALDFKKHIEVLHYLLQLWPVHNTKESSQNNTALMQPESLNCLRRKKRPQVLNLTNPEYTGMLRPRLARLDSPSSNRYARDWSSCGENYFLPLKESNGEADYDDVPSEESTESEEDYSKTNGPNNVTECSQNISKEHTYQAFMKLQEIDTSVDNRVNLRHLQESIDMLLGSLEHELSKSNKLNISY
ncbi:rho GTPase-activating protein SYDE2 isoform X2 [Protopterus annectens]|uniref:rho GTPase-activating protein SYDE2 isoform X2 n=1 Tax=Protopterus annectens TaxID=7888 RepID=UPI001CF985B9|nr:rho GTPase-activating protein SYDE2 isoform X2 [Protopterus annectens]